MSEGERERGRESIEEQISGLNERGREVWLRRRGAAEWNEKIEGVMDERGEEEKQPRAPLIYSIHHTFQFDNKRVEE